jgi:hypothetical protein
MRILIIALERSGGTQLTKWISWEMGYKPIHEPIIHSLSIEGDNIVVKYLITEIIDRNDIDLTNWDKIIGLIRMDTYETAISQTVAQEQKKWIDSYEISNEWINNNIKLINESQKNIKSNINYLKAIEEIKVLVSYESIYNTKEDIQRIKDYIGIKNTKYEYLLNNRNRLRKKNKLI